MRSVLAPAAIAAVITVTVARCAVALLHRFAELRRLGRLPNRRPAYVPVRVRASESRVHAAVYVGSNDQPGGEGFDDVDDMGLLARAMASSPRRRRPLVEQIHPTGPEFPAELFEDPEERELPVRASATIAAGIAALLGIPAIVRPLEAWAPAVAVAAFACTGVAWWLSRRS